MTWSFKIHTASFPHLIHRKQNESNIPIERDKIMEALSDQRNTIASNTAYDNGTLLQMAS